MLSGLAENILRNTEKLLLTEAVMPVIKSKIAPKFQEL